MAITTDGQLVAAIAAGQRIRMTKTASFATVAAQWFSTLDVAGAPGAGSLNVGNTTTGIVPTDAVAGFPTINPFTGAATGYLSKLAWRNTVASTMCLYDRLFHAGSISLTALATTTLSGQPSYLGRSPGGAGLGLEIWLEINAAVSATATTVAVNYTNEAGTGGRTTGASASLSGFGSRRLLQLPCQAGDKGVRLIESVTVGGTVATTGSVNVIVARTLADSVRVGIANDGGQAGWDMTQLPDVFTDSALWMTVAPDSTASGAPEITATVING